MPRSQHEFVYNINDDVRIIGLDNCRGKVDQMVVDKTGKQYRVRYWFEGHRESCWVDDDEILPIEG